MLKKNYKEIISYLFFGICTTLISIGSFAFFNIILQCNEHVSNIISWILAVSFAYVTNRFFVFTQRAHGVSKIAKEMAAFILSRLSTLLIEEVIIFIFITKLSFESIIVKTAAQVIVIILNYVLSKCLVFRKKD